MFQKFWNRTTKKDHLVLLSETFLIVDSEPLSVFAPSHSIDRPAASLDYFARAGLQNCSHSHDFSRQIIQVAVQHWIRQPNNFSAKTRETALLFIDYISNCYGNVNNPFFILTYFAHCSGVLCGRHKLSGLIITNTFSLACVWYVESLLI